MDLNKSLRVAIDTGNVFVGSKQACKAIDSGTAKLIILASNCPKDTVDVADGGKIPVYSFDGNNAVLGAACGKPFPVSSLCILDPGQSDLLQLAPNV